jgi:hypothetical protein
MTMKSGKNRTLKTAGCATYKVYLYALPRMIAVQTLAKKQSRMVGGNHSRDPGILTASRPVQPPWCFYQTERVGTG